MKEIFLMSWTSDGRQVGRPSCIFEVAWLENAFGARDFAGRQGVTGIEKRAKEASQLGTLF